MTALAALVAVIGGVAGATLLRRAWADRQRERVGLIVSGWAVLVGTVLLDAAWVGWVKGSALAVAGIGLAALIVVVQGRTVRAARAGRSASLAPEPLEGPSKAWRGWLKALLAGPLGMTAAMGIAFCYATWAPGDPRTRIIVGGPLMPVVWALAMTWTLADQRLLRSLAVLLGTTVAGFTLAAMRGLV